MVEGLAKLREDGILIQNWEVSKIIVHYILLHLHYLFRRKPWHFDESELETSELHWIIKFHEPAHMTFKGF